MPTLAAAQDLALKRVMLSSGGLGYFEYEATVEGDATLKLTVSLQQVDDVLKSLVVYDDKGGVGGLSLPGREPLAQAFKDLPFDQDSLASPADLLATLKGAQVTVGGSRAITGRIVSVQEETVALADGKATTKRTRVTLLTDRGLQQFILEDAENLQFADQALRDKVTQALLAIQTNRAKDARTLELATRGQGKRTVRVAYIVEVPVWKASYRLTLPGDPAAARSALQGWATIENLSGQDWKDIELTLVSGRPVAFHQALYDAYYVKRPEVPVEVAGRLMPGIDRGGVEAAKAAPPPPPAPAGGAAVSAAAGAQRWPRRRRRQPPVAGAADQVEATDAATQVVFKYPRAVSVDNGRTLSIPIIDRQVPAQRLALYQAETAARNPLAAIRLTNDGDSGLPPGIITIYERDKAGYVAYVGDARLSGFPVGETRLLAYALDEKITVERDAAQTERIATGTIAQGALRLSRVIRQTVTYRVRGPAKEPRQLVVVQRRLPGWTLVKPDAKSVELSEGNYRIPFQLPGGDQTQTFEVVQEQIQQQELRLVDGAADQIRVYAQAQRVRRQDARRAHQGAAAPGRRRRRPAQGDARPTPSGSRSSRSRRACATTSPACRPTATCSGATSPRSTSRRPSSRRSPSAGPTPRRPSRPRATRCGPTWRSWVALPPRTLSPSIARRPRPAEVTRPQRPHRVVAAEEVEQGAQRRAALGLQVGIAIDHQPRVVAGGLQQLGMGGEVGQPHVGQAALARAQKLAGAAQAEILLGDAKAVLGLAHDGEPRLGGLAERLGVEQQAGRLGGAAADPAAQLVELGQAEALGMLDHHHRRRRHVDADLDHRGGDQDRQAAVGERRHRRLALGALQASVQQADLAGKARAQLAEALLDIGEVDFLRFLDQRAHPVDAPARRDLPADAVDHLADALQRNGAGVDRLPAGRLLGELGDVEVAVGREHQRARDGRGGHDQKIDGMALGRQRHALVHAEAMLLVDHGQGEVGELDVLLHQRMRADHEMDRAVGQALQRLLLLLLAVAAGEQRQAHAGRFGERRDGGVMLAGQKLGRRHEGGLRARLDADQHGEEGDHGLAAADIALQQADHALGLAEVGLDLADRGVLAGRQLERQRRQRQLAQAAVAFGDVSGDAAVVMAHQGDRELAGQKLVEGEARACRMHRREVALLGRRVSLGERRLPVGPAIAGEIRRVLPFRQLRRALDGGGDRLLHRPLGEAGGQAIDRLDPQDRLALVERHDMVGVRHLHLALVEIDLAAHHPDLAQRAAAS